jgi:hypothetical protein
MHAPGERRRRLRRRRGTALIEFIMAVPFFALLMGLTFFFGWSMKNQQHVRISDRYVAWRDVRVGRYDPNDLNEKFYGGTATSVDVARGGGPDRTLEDLADEASNNSAEAGTLAEECAVNRWPRGRRVEIHAEFPADVGLWRDLGLNGPIRSEHMRDGVEWRCGDRVFNNGPVKEQFLRDFDRSLPNTRMGRVLRILYDYKWKMVNLPDD